jgi:hypothetical protein
VLEMETKYAVEHDIIATFELRLMHFEDQAEDLESRKHRIENDLRMQIEIKAEDKTSGLTNEKKRQIAYEELADCNEELQGLILQIRDIRRECKKLRIEIDNEKRAFQLMVKGE